MSKQKTFIDVVRSKYGGFMSRCYRDSDKDFARYGGRGIRVASTWIRDVHNFKNWVEDQLLIQDIRKEDFVANPRQYQLDRIDNNGHYSPENCQFLSPQDNCRNKGNVKRIVTSAEGEEIEL